MQKLENFAESGRTGNNTVTEESSVLYEKIKIREQFFAELFSKFCASMESVQRKFHIFRQKIKSGEFFLGGAAPLTLSSTKSSIFQVLNLLLMFPNLLLI